MKRVFFLLVLIALIFVSNYGYSQEDILRPNGRKIIGNQVQRTNNHHYSNPWIIGVDAGVNYNMYSSDMAYSPVLPDPGTLAFKTGSGFSPYLNFNVGYEFNDKFALHLRLGYDGKYVKNDKEGNIDIPDVNGGLLMIAREKIGYDESMDYINLSLDLRYNITNEVFLTFGLFNNILFGDQVLQLDQYMLTPGQFYNVPGNLTEVHNKYTASDLLKTTSITGLNLGLGYKFELQKNLFIVPQIKFQYSLTPFDENTTSTDSQSYISSGVSNITTTNKTLNSLQFGLGLWYKL